MPKKHISFVLLLVLAASACAAQKQEEPAQPQDKQSQYASLLERVNEGDLSIDFQQLRFSYMDSPERHKAKDTSDQEKEMWQALNRKDYKKAVENADVVLANQFVSLDAHFVEYRAYLELQNASLSDFHKSVFAGLLKSITDSGDGKTPKTAYVVISTHEEYVLLSVRGLMPGRQSLVNEGGHNYDLLEARDPQSNQTVKLYFNVDIPFKHYLQ
ncbi:MAG TPA: DUF4919 domain-containing protein [Candidatus Angelobacter sp.]